MCPNTGAFRLASLQSQNIRSNWWLGAIWGFSVGLQLKPSQHMRSNGVELRGSSIGVHTRASTQAIQPGDLTLRAKPTAMYWMQKPRTMVPATWSTPGVAPTARDFERLRPNCSWGDHHAVGHRLPSSDLKTTCPTCDSSAKLATIVQP